MLFIAFDAQMAPKYEKCLKFRVPEVIPDASWGYMTIYQNDQDTQLNTFWGFLGCINAPHKKTAGVGQVCAKTPKNGNTSTFRAPGAREKNFHGAHLIRLTFLYIILRSHAFWTDSNKKPLGSVKILRNCPFDMRISISPPFKKPKFRRRGGDV